MAGIADSISGPSERTYVFFMGSVLRMIHLPPKVKGKEEAMSGSLLFPHLTANPPLTLTPLPQFPFWCMGVH